MGQPSTYSITQKKLHLNLSCVCHKHIDYQGFSGLPGRGMCPLESIFHSHHDLNAPQTFTQQNKCTKTCVPTCLSQYHGFTAVCPSNMVVSLTKTPQNAISKAIYAFHMSKRPNQRVFLASYIKLRSLHVWVPKEPLLNPNLVRKHVSWPFSGLFC